MKYSSRQNQQGVVIVVALFIVALVATMAYTMMARLDRDTQRTAMIVHNVQAELYAQGSIAWARDTLRQNWENHKTDQLVDRIPITSPSEVVNGYTITSKIEDMQGRFNLNNLDHVDTQQGFKQLIRALNPKLSDSQAAAIVKATVDWIVRGVQRNEWSQYYLELPMPYRPAHQPMAMSSELRLVKGVTQAIYNSLQPYITALPGYTLINVQTAPAPVLLTMSPVMTLEAAKVIESLRHEKPFVNPQTFLDGDVVKNQHVRADQVAVMSQYFQVETIVSTDTQRIVMYTLLQRVTEDKTAKVNVIWQSKGL